MSLRSERCKVDRMRKSSNGALPVAGGRATRKFLFGMRFFESVAGEMRRARSLLSRRKKRVSAIEPTFKRGWTCMMGRKGERQLPPKAETHHLQNWEGRECNYRVLLQAMKLRLIYRPS